MATKKLTPAMQQLVHALEVYGYLDPIRDGGRVATYVGLIERGIIRPHARRVDPYFPATVREEVEEEAYAEYDRRTAEARAHAECPEQWTQVDEDGTEMHVRQSRQGYPIEIERGGHRFWYVRINGRTPMTASGTFEEARLAADRFERNQAHGDALEEYREVTRAARKADADAYQRELASKATVVNIPLPPAAKIGITDADGNELCIGDVVRVDGDPTLYGTVYRGAGDDVWAVPLGSERERLIDATRMRRVERQADGSFPEARRETESAQVAKDIRNGNYSIVMGEPVTSGRACSAGRIDAPTTDGGTCAECEQPEAAEMPKYPKGTPEYDAYATELRGELRKWAAGEVPYEYPAPEVGLKVGDLVQRVGEEGPGKPVGKVLEVRDWPIVGVLVKVTFEGTAAVQKQVKDLVKVPAPCCTSTTQGGITTHENHCPRFARPIRDVHTSHCCKRHGCKYGYGDPAREARCTVVSGKAPQEHPCEVCKDDPEPGEQLAAALADLVELRRETFRLWSAGTVGRREGLARLDRIEAALRGVQQPQQVDPAHVADVARHPFRQVLAVQGLPELHNEASRRFERAIDRIREVAAGR